uniref:cDNA FLJ50658, highly similar to T-cell surface glycoprotein CD4 n=1 Tax=Homo sapiens TaxID=9606 RepID=UPI0015E26FB9|nr:Chain D, cDNA FLJ50658, highly similar to T-cell surface glycoprotein CD4 [Homo sapiens]
GVDGSDEASELACPTPKEDGLAQQQTQLNLRGSGSGCVRCRHRRRQAERMSQIKRLLSEKKT